MNPGPAPPAGRPAPPDDEPVPRARLVAQCRPEPDVLGGDVIGHHVGNHPDPRGVRLGDQPLRLAQRAVRRLDVPEVGDVVARVRHG